MAKVTDIQDKNGVSKEIQDKDLANRTSQSTIASSDYVLLEDTDGAYHKIAKASFTEAVRGALGSVINSVAKGTDIAKIPVLDSSNDLGMGTLANVASVLGVATKKAISQSEVSSLGAGVGIYSASVDGLGNGILIHMCISWGAQIFIAYDKMYFRRSTNENNFTVWEPWRQCSVVS